MSQDVTKFIAIRGARTHNLQNISLNIPRDRFVVVTGLSGSGKSSLAFDTIYAEGQRRYVESLSAYARQFLGQMLKPDVDHIDGLPPTLAIAQQAGRGSPRSTVATATEIHDYLRLLFARVGTPHCPKCDRVIHRQTVPQIVDEVLALPEGTKLMILAPLVRDRTGDHRAALERAVRDGFVRLRIDGRIVEAKDAPALDAKQSHTIEAVVDRLVMKPDLRNRLGESIEAALRAGGGLVIVTREERSAVSGQRSAGGGEAAWADAIYSENYACIACGISVPELHPRMFSFNSPHGACPTCDGLGRVLEFDERRVAPDAAKSLEDGAIEPWRRAGPKLAEIYAGLIREFCKRFKVLPSAPLKSMPARSRNILLHGTSAEDEKELGWRFEGVLPNLRRRWQTTESESARERLHEYMVASRCPACAGARLRPEALAVHVGELSIDDIAQLSIDAAAGFFSKLAFAGEQARIAGPIVDEIRRRLAFMIDVGIGYLTLAREGRTLSGGEAQRIRLATQIGSGLVGVCYVLDEPTTGLHPRDTARLLRTLRRLVEMGNSLLVVEHDADVIRQADWIVDVGPGAGANGGRVLVNGTLEELLASQESVTGRYLGGVVASGEFHVASAGDRKRREVSKKVLEIKGAAENNLRKIDVRIPLGVFCCVTGVSGSGKSTLVNQILLPAVRSKLLGSAERAGAHEKISGIQHIDKVIEIDQGPIGRSPRSGPATYTGIFDQVRELMAKTREAKMRGYGAARFSFNVKGGRCEACRGQGLRRIEMHFLPDMFVECDQCKGTRYSREMLDIRYRGRTIDDILALRVDEALEFFDAIPAIRSILAAMVDVGLGYMALGQPASTLSGGEAQRVKLAAELGKSAAGHTLYVLDEPTSGLHFADIDRLLAVLNRLCDAGHSIVVIEHNLEVIRQADWIIDLGPEGGDAGGRVVAEGSPDEVAKNARSHTGHCLVGMFAAKRD